MNNNNTRRSETFRSNIRAAAFAVMSVAGIAASGPSAHAVPLLNGFGGEAGFGQRAMDPNDDGSSNQVDLPFEINFFGTTHNSFFVNNNGNVTFGGATGAFTPDPFPLGGNPMIAPFWGDVDTRCNECGNVYIASPNEDTVVVTWNNVGYYSQQTNKINNFQLALRDRGNDFEQGDFDIEFRYDRLEWTTGDASDGDDGLAGENGTAAQAGFDSGNGQDYFTLPGSRTDQVLNLENYSNIVGGPGGLWSFAVRQGSVPGSSPDNPLMPVVSQAGWEFDFNVDLDQQVFIDPEIAIGYDYVVNSGPNIQTVLLPTDIGDGIYELWLWNDLEFVLADSVVGGNLYDFGPGGVDRFRILGIEQSAGLDPDNTLAFVTGLTFADSGLVNMLQIPITIDTDPSDVPEPSILLMMLFGLAGLGLLTREKMLQQRQIR